MVNAEWTVGQYESEIRCLTCGHMHLEQTEAQTKIRTDVCQVTSCSCRFYMAEPTTEVKLVEQLQRDVPVDAINPAHYRDGKIEVWDFIADKNLNFLLGNVVKYVCRAGKKEIADPKEDLKKAANYLAREIKRIEELENSKKNMFNIE